MPTPSVSSARAASDPTPAVSTDELIDLLRRRSDGWDVLLDAAADRLHALYYANPSPASVPSGGASEPPPGEPIENLLSEFIRASGDVRTAMNVDQPWEGLSAHAHALESQLRGAIRRLASTLTRVTAERDEANITIRDLKFSHFNEIAAARADTETIRRVVTPEDIRMLRDSAEDDHAAYENSDALRDLATRLASVSPREPDPT